MQCNQSLAFSNVTVVKVNSYLIQSNGTGKTPTKPHDQTKRDQRLIQTSLQSPKPK